MYAIVTESRRCMNVAYATGGPVKWLLIAVLSAALAQSRAAGQSLVIQGGSLFDPAAGEMRPIGGIVIEGGRIKQMLAPGDKLAVPADLRRVDARGKYLVPGLIDAHVHLVHVLDFAHVTGDEVLPLYLAAGVTSVRDTGDEIVAETLVSRYADAHPESSPRVFRCSPLIDADPPIHRDIGYPLVDPARVPAFVDEMAQWRVTTLKIYAGTARPVGRKVIEEGHKRGLKVTAHLGPYSAQDAVDDGIDCLEHIWSVFNYVIPAEATKQPNYRSTLNLDNPITRDLTARITRKGVAVDPTLAVFRNMILLNDRSEYHNHTDNTHVPARLRKWWDGYRTRSALKPETLEARRGEFKKYQELTGILHRAGVTLLAGTDAPEPYVPPGFSLHQELEMLVESGLSPAAALRAATLSNARALGQGDHLGSIEPGKLADLLIVSANPLLDIRNSRKIDHVIRGGIVCDPAALLHQVPRN